ncbi:MAG: ankyrin repeat domain-containing protein [Candidatus Babeliales bacterium]|jgi:ankyrin repeat protein
MKKNLSIKTLAIIVLPSLVAINTQSAQNPMNGYPRPKPVAAQLTMQNSAANKTLFQAIQQGDKRTVSALIKEGNVNVNAMSKKGTPLIAAAKQAAKNPTMDSQMASIVKILLKSDANPSLTGPKGMTALMWAAKGGANKTAKALLPDKNIREQTINMEDDQGNSALYFASKEGNDSTVSLLLSYKEIRPTQMAIMKAKFQNIKNKIQDKMDKLVKEGKIQVKRVQEKYF